MNNHERQGEPSHQPDQPDIETQAYAWAASFPNAIESRLELLQTIDADHPLDALDLDILRAVDDLPGIDVPPGLPPKLLELWQQEDEARNNTLPPDTPQQ
jgi:hypothetical protein